jgi:hypothetical protein
LLDRPLDRLTDPTLFEEKLYFDSPFFGFSPAEPNARPEPHPRAAATQERRLLGVGSRPMLGVMYEPVEMK